MTADQIATGIAVIRDLGIYAAGFPLGDPEYTLTVGKCVLSKHTGRVEDTHFVEHRRCPARSADFVVDHHLRRQR